MKRQAVRLHRARPDVNHAATSAAPLPSTGRATRPLPRIFFAAAVVLAAHLGVAAALAGGVDAAVLDAQRTRVATIDKLAPAAVAIFDPSGSGGGSGVIITPDGYALTNFHVVASGPFFKCGLNDGNVYDAVVGGVDPTGDVALVKLLGRDNFPTATWGDSDSVRVGDWVYVLGNPFLLAADFQPTVTYGIVSGIHRYQYPAGTILEYTDCLQVDASVNPGNSGGPLFNGAGELIGINGRISVAQRGRVNAGAGYAISINQVRNFLGHLRSGRIVDHATLGATVSRDSHGTVVISQILDQSDAFRRGLRDDDELVSFAGRSIHSVNQFKNVLGIFPERWKVPLVFRRNGEKHEIQVRLSSLHTKSELIELSGQAPPPIEPDKRPPDRRPERPPPTPPNDRPRRQPPRGRPGPPVTPRAPLVPEKYKQLYEARPGFTNYRFNQLEQARTLRGLDGLGDYRGRASWTFSGTTTAGVPFECTLAATFASLELGGKAYLQSLDQEPQDEPAGTGGLLVTLNQFRLLLTQREKGFSSLVYFGTEPLNGFGPTVDVLESTAGSVESRWYFSAATGALLGLDARLLEDAQDCEIRFGDMGTFDGVRFPSEIVVRHGGAEYATFRILQVKGRR